MPVIKTNLTAQLQAKINSVSGTTTIDELIQLRRAARNLGLDETSLDTELSTRIAGLNGTSTIDALLEASIALPAPTELGAINEIRAFVSDEDTLTDQFGGFWQRAGVISYDVAQFPLANKIPLIDSQTSVAPTPVAQAALSGMTSKRIASSGSVVVAINAAGNGITRWTNNFTTTGSALTMTGVLAGTTWVAITYDERLQLFVMIGHSSTKIAKSSDGLNWSTVALPSSPPAWSNAGNAVVFGGKTKFHLFILNKHWQSNDLSSWVAQPDIPAPNAEGQTLSALDLRGVVETLNGQLLLWGNYYSTSASRTRPFVAVSDTGSGLSAVFGNFNNIGVTVDLRLSAAGARSATEFELWFTCPSQTSSRSPWKIARNDNGSFSLIQIDNADAYSMEEAEVPTHVLNYQGLMIRVSQVAITALNVNRSVTLPYTLSGSYLIRAAVRANGGTVIIRLGTTLYACGVSTAVTPFDFKQFVGLPTQSYLSIGGYSPALASLASHYVRTK